MSKPNTPSKKGTARRKSFADFTLTELEATFDLQRSRASLFSKVKAIAIDARLAEALSLGRVPGLSTEKARSEFLVAPLLLRVQQQLKGSVSLYSGMPLDVAPDKGLRGICDFMFAKGPQFPEPKAPLCVLVEAKKHDIELGIGQCVAEMLAAQMFNQQHGTPQKHIHGCVTTGELWQFLRLTGTVLTLDADRYVLDQADRLLGIFTSILS